MSCRCRCCRSTRWQRDPIDRWSEDWNRAARAMDPGFEERRTTRRAEQQRRLRRLAEHAERERRESDPNVN